MVAAVPLLGYKPPVVGPISAASHGLASVYYDYSIVDPVTNERITDVTPTISAAPSSYTFNTGSNSGVFYYCHYYPNPMSSEGWMVGFSVYDPTRGHWQKWDNFDVGSSLNVAFNDGIAAFVAKSGNNYYIKVGVYNPETGQWVTSYQPLGAVYGGGPTLCVANGVVAIAGTGNPNLDGGWVEYTIYDPARKQWVWGTDYNSYRGMIEVTQGTIYYYPTYYGGVRTARGYSSDTTTWAYNRQTKAIAAFCVGHSYRSTIPSTTVWLTDMSAAGVSVAINWGDSTAQGSGSGYHSYSGPMTPTGRTITESVTSPDGTTVTCSYPNYTGGMYPIYVPAVAYVYGYFWTGMRYELQFTEPMVPGSTTTWYLFGPEFYTPSPPYGLYTTDPFL